MKVYSYNRRRIKYIFVMVCIAATVIIGRLAYIMVLKAKYYSERADNLHERERSIKDTPRQDIRQKWEYTCGQQGSMFGVRHT